MDSVDEAHPVVAGAHDDGMRPGAVCQVPDTAEQVAVRDARRGDDHLAGCKLLGRERPLDVVDPVLSGLTDLAARGRPELCLELAAQTPEGRRGDERLAGAADSDCEVSFVPRIAAVMDAVTSPSWIS